MSPWLIPKHYPTVSRNSVLLQTDRSMDENIVGQVLLGKVDLESLLLRSASLTLIGRPVGLFPPSSGHRWDNPSGVSIAT